MLSGKPWRPEAVLLLVSGLFLSLFIGLSGQLMLAHMLSTLGDSFRRFLNFVTNIVAFQGVALVLISLFLKAHAVAWRDFLGARQPGLGKALSGAVAAGLVLVPLGLLLNGVAAAVMKAIGLTPELQSTVQVLQESQGLLKRLSFALPAVFLAPVVEEGLFRGILYPALKQQGYPKVALFGTSFLFASIHVNLMTFVPLTVFALAMIWLYERTDTLLAPITAHCLFNGSNFLLFIWNVELGEWLDRLM